MKLLTNYSEYRTATFRIKSASWVVIECEWIFRKHLRQQQLETDHLKKCYYNVTHLFKKTSCVRLRVLTKYQIAN